MILLVTSVQVAPAHSKGVIQMRQWEVLRVVRNSTTLEDIDNFCLFRNSNYRILICQHNYMSSQLSEHMPNLLNCPDHPAIPSSVGQFLCSAVVKHLLKTIIG